VQIQKKMDSSQDFDTSLMSTEGEPDKSLSSMAKMHLGIGAIAAALYGYRLMQKDSMDAMKDEKAQFFLNPSQLYVPGLLLLALLMWHMDANMTFQHVVLGGAVVVAGVQLAGEMGAEEWIGKTFKIKGFERQDF